MYIENLTLLLHHELADAHSAEDQIIRALPEMITAAANADLRTALQDHLAQTKGHLQRLKKIQEKLTYDTSAKCMGVEGIIKEGKKLLDHITDPATKDAALIASAQRVEHYEIAVYGTAIRYAQQLEFGDVAALLKEILDEEEGADNKLTKIAEGGLFTTGLNEIADHQ